MKEKDVYIAEDTLAQLNNSRTSQTVLKSLYSKLNSSNLSSVQRVRLLKIVVLHCTKDGSSTDLKVAALTAGLSIVLSDFSTSPHPASGATFNLLEVCYKFVMEYVENSNPEYIEIVKKALQILSLINAATASKLFCDKSSANLMKIMNFCLKIDEFKLHTLKLLAVGVSVPKFEPFSEDKIVLTRLVYPLIFNAEDVDVQRLALKVMQGLNLSTKPQPLWNQLKEDTQKVHCKRLVEMVNSKSNWPEAWQFVVNLFGEELHSGGQLINHMLEVLERAFKHPDFEWTRVQAFECWNTLIENFKSGLKNRKRIDLIMIPLKANNHRIETLALAKLKTYDHLLKTLGQDLASSHDIILNFISFCFGSEKTTCLPVKSYPALHERCADCFKDVLVSPCIEIFFMKVHKELINAVADCFMMEKVPSDSIAQIFNRLLDLVKKQEGTDVVKTLLTTVNNLVTYAGSGDLNGSLKMRRTMSPPRSPTSPQQQSPNDLLGCKIVSIILHGLVQGKFALKKNLFMCRSLYVGSFDVMCGTPTLLFIEWLLSPALMLGAGNSDEYKQLLSKLMNIRREELNGFMDFTELVLKKLLVFEDNLNANKMVLLYKYSTDVWCTLAEELVEFIRNQGSINQGDAAEHDFHTLYSVLMFPVQNLHVDFCFIEKCRQPWSNLFYEACQQVELLPTSSLQFLCEEVCVHLSSFGRRNSTTKKDASIYFFLTCILEVASAKFKSKKSLRWVQQYISDLVRELNDLAIDQELVFTQAVTCIQHCLQLNAVTAEVLECISPTLCSLLKVKINTYEPVDKLCTLLGVLKQASLAVHQHGSSKETVNGLLQNVINAGKSHSSQKVRSAVWELCDAFNESKPDDGEKSQTAASNGAFSPANRISFSPKPASKKFTTIQMSPSNLSNSGSKRKLQTTVCGSDGKFVRIETPPKKIILTEHQKEVRRERRQDIPALYQDLSQDTQSMSQDSTQDFVALPVTPKGKSNVAMDEDAVMDVVDIDSSIQVLCVKKADSPKCTRKGQFTAEPKSGSQSFTPPAGFVLPPIANNTESVPETKAANQEQTSDFKQEMHPGKENENVSSASKCDKSIRTPQKGAITRSSLSSNNSTTRSGKILKRNSIAPESDLLKQRKSARKSLSVNGPEELLKNSASETIVIESDTTDSESVSSIASDVGNSNSKSKKPFVLKTRRSLKREVFLESEPELASKAEKKMIRIKNVTDKTDGDVCKTDTDEEPRVNDHLKKVQTDDLPVAKLFGGKILTRSRSNSSLDDVVMLGKKPKNTSSDSSDKAAATSSVEASPAVSESPEKYCECPSKNSSRENILINTSDMSEDPSSSKKSSDTSDVNDDLPLKLRVVERFSVNATNALTETDDQNSASPKSHEKSQSTSSESLSCEDDKRREYAEKEAVHTSSSPSQSKELSNSMGEDSTCSSINESTDHEESQEIIESSQEPAIKLKPCLVSLEQFRCSEPNETIELASLVVEKGPKATSPYKVRSKDTSEIHEVTQNDVCRRSLNLDSAEKAQPSSVSPTGSPSKTSAAAAKSESPTCGMEITTKKKKLFSNDPSKISVSTDTETKGILKVIHNKVDGKELDASSIDEVVPQSRNNSMPEWMHDKKISPPTKASRTIRSASARSQAFMKSVADAGFSTSPPKGMDVSPLSSPVQSKKLHRTILDSNTTPIIKRSSRAAQLLGLGQAAAARGGETVVSSASRPGRMELEEVEPVANNAGSVSSTTSGCSSANAGSSANTILNTVSATTTSAPVASPSVRSSRNSRLLDLDSLKSTPQKCLEDKGLKEDWVPKDPRAKATPDSSILKRKRESDSDAPSPSLKRKRVSFRDPPLSTLLRFGDTFEGTVFSSDQSTGPEKVAEAVSSDYEVKKSIRIVDVEESEKEKSAGELELQSVNSETRIELRCSPQGKANGKLSLQTSLKKNIMTASPPKLDSPVPINEVDQDTMDDIKEDSEKSNGMDKSEEDLPDLPNQCGRKKSNKTSETELSGRPGSEHYSTSEENVGQVNLETGPVESACRMEVDIVEDTPELDKSPQSSCEQSEAETQGMLDDLHRVPSLSSPVFVNLIDCTHPIECISSKLTSLVWEKSLLRELREAKIHTIGDFARLTEDQLDRLRVKPPKRTNAFCVLEDFEKQHSSQDGVNCKLLKNCKMSPVKSQNKLEDILAKSSQEDIMEALSKLGRKSEFCQAAIQSLQPKEVINSLKLEDVIPSLKLEDVMNSLQPEVVAAAIGSNHDVLKHLPADVGAEVYLSQIGNSSGRKEKTMSVDDLSSLLSRVPGRIIQGTLFPSVPSLLSSVYTDFMRDYVLRECEPSEIVQQLDSSKSEELAVKLIPEINPLVFAQKVSGAKSEEFAVSLLPKLNPSVLVQNLDATKAEEIAIKLLSNLSASVLAEEIDSAKAGELTTKLLSKMNPSDIVRIIDDKKCEVIVEVFLSKLNIKNRLKFLLEHSLHEVDQLD